MKHSFKIFVGVIFFSFFIFSMSSCAKKGYGCPGENTDINAKSIEDLPTKRGKSQLFSKKQRKKMKSNRTN